MTVYAGKQSLLTTQRPTVSFSTPLKQPAFTASQAARPVFRGARTLSFLRPALRPGKRVTGLANVVRPIMHLVPRAKLIDGATVTEAMHGAGFNLTGHFHATTDQVLRMSAKHFRDGGAGNVIRFANGECALGAIMVAGTERGVCAIILGDDPNVLVRELQDRFYKATLIGDDPEFERYVAQAVGFVEAPSIGLELPLDIQGTAFQQRVWQALCKIPAGSTASYAEIAERIGSPTSSRAVAGACAANKLALAIPCHRVVRTDGNLSGYRWGVERKRQLLEKEAKLSK